MISTVEFTVLARITVRESASGRTVLGIGEQHTAMSKRGLRGIAVLDIGATNVKAVLFDADLRVHAEESMPSVPKEGSPYLSIDTEPIVLLATRILPEFDSVLPVDAIVPCAHGSAAALLNAAGALALPIMCYEAEPPADVVSSYEKIAPAFEEVLAPTNPMALTLARQLLWQETHYPEAFARVSSIMPLAQYIAFRLCGARSNEVSAMGAQTHLWAPLRRDYSTLSRHRGWASRFPEIRPAWQDLGCAKHLRMKGRARVLTGVHDSNANLLPYLGDAPFALLSTGTWVIGFAQGVDLGTLDPVFDQVSNTTVFGDPVASCRFMGGREYEIVSQGAPPDLASAHGVAELLEREVAAWPSFTASGGPAPRTGGKGYVEGTVENARERASLASLYCAQMSALALLRIGAAGRIIVDGPFSDNDAYLQVLAACLPSQQVFAATSGSGTAVGAASLALLGEDARAPTAQRPLRSVEVPSRLMGNPALRSWFNQVEIRD